MSFFFTVSIRYQQGCVLLWKVGLHNQAKEQINRECMRWYKLLFLRNHWSWDGGRGQGKSEVAGHLGWDISCTVRLVSLALISIFQQTFGILVLMMCFVLLQSWWSAQWSLPITWNRRYVLFTCCICFRSAKKVTAKVGDKTITVN